MLARKPLREPAPDEYQRVQIDFAEANIPVNYTTWETQFTIPASLPEQPNCGVFNWQTTLMHWTGRMGHQPGRP
jgi:hypothetical protein